MRRLLLAAVGAMALAGGATAANAASVVTGPIPATLTPPSSAIFGSNVTGGPTTFNDNFIFTILGSSALVDAQVSTLLGPGSSQNINFTTLTLDGMSLFTKTSSDPNPETWAILSPVLLGVGAHTINLQGNLAGPTGSYSGTINVNIAPVPEAKTWAMMLIGFGAMGFAIRRRRKPVLAQVA